MIGDGVTPSGCEQALRDAAGVVTAIRATLADIERASRTMMSALHADGRILSCGNGGSALQAQHFAAELIGHFRRRRAPLPALALSADTGVVTALANDYRYEDIFSRQVRALGRPGDVLLAFSTSGRSPNVINAVEAARVQGMRTIALTGSGGEHLARLADQALVVPSADTARIQEGHLLVIHLICEQIDAEFAGA